MKREYELSNVAKDYLSRFYDILDEMIAEMSGAELTGSISHNFIVQMIPTTALPLRCREIFCSTPPMCRCRR